jgi:iron(III) transport system permease protein
MNFKRALFFRDPHVSLSVILLFALTGLFVLYPVFSALKLSLTKNGVWTLQSYLEIFEKSWLHRSFFNSLLLGTLSASASVVLGFLFAFGITRTAIRGKAFFRLMATLPMISPPFMLTLSVILLFGKNGFITYQVFGLENFNVYGLWGLVFVQTLSMFPIAYLTIAGVLRGIDSSIEDASSDLGASRWHVFRSITLPLSAPGLIAAWLLVFVTSLADFANPMILAGKFDVLSVQAYLQFTGMGNLELGAALSNVLLIPCLLAYFLQRWYLKNKSYVTITGKPQLRQRDLTSKAVRTLLFFILLLVSIMTCLLYATVLAGCFTKSWGIDYQLSLENFRYVFEIGWQTIQSTVLLASIATPIAGILAMLTAFLIVRKQFWGKRFLEASSLFPFALPGTTIGIGYVLAFNDKPLLLTGTASIIVLAFVFRNVPVGIEAAKASLLQLDKSIEEAAQDLGANSARCFKDVTLPMIKPAWFTGMAYVFVHCMTAVSAVIFLISAKWNHMTVLILSQTEILRFSAASVLCLILICIVLAAFGLIKLLLGKNALELRQS